MQNIDQSRASTSAIGAWNSGRLIGQKPPLKRRDIWAIRVRLQLSDRKRDLALFNLAIDSKLRGCDLVAIRIADISTGQEIHSRAIVIQKKTTCLTKDRDTLLAFYDVPAEHWQHVRNTNPIESTFATVRLRTNKTRGCLSRDTALAMVFKLVKSAERHWRRLNDTNRLGQIIEGVKFRDGEPIEETKDHAAA